MEKVGKLLENFPEKSGIAEWVGKSSVKSEFCLEVFWKSQKTFESQKISE